MTESHHPFERRSHFVIVAMQGRQSPRFEDAGW
jgi:hypothetical protein